MELELIQKEIFHIQLVSLVKMSLFLELVIGQKVHANNRAKSILVLGKDFIQGIDDTKIYAEKCIQLVLVQLGKDSL